MRFMAVCAMTVLLAGVAAAQSISDRVIELKTGDHTSINVPLSLPYDGPAVEGTVRAVQAGTGEEFPVTVRDGELVFVPEGGVAKQTQTYTLEVEKGDQRAAPRVRIEKQEGKDILDVFIDDVHFTSYNYSGEWKKPFLWPVLLEGGQGLTRDYPMDPTDTPADHPHHKGFWTAHGSVNGVDCWAEGENSGFQKTLEVTSGPGDAYGWIHAKNVWEDKDHKPVLSEEREYRFYATPEAGRLFDVFVTFTADQGEVKFGDTKEGGIVAYRVREEMTESKGGIITNSLGDKGEATAWGKPAAWCDYSANLENAGMRGITVFDNAKNLRFPTSWHVRNYGLNGANPFGYHNFIEKDYNKALLPANGDYMLKANDTLHFEYRVYIHSGDVDQAKVADRYADYATPPVVAWKAKK